MRHLDQLLITAITVAMEAGGEPYQGKLAVAYVICNRSDKQNKSLTDVCLQPYQFSCWNTESPTRQNVDDIPDRTMAESLKATFDAYYKLVPDPTNGAVYYLNPAALDKLPTWWHTDTDPDSQVVIGNHVFRSA